MACYTNWPGASDNVVRMASVVDGTSNTVAYSEFGTVPPDPNSTGKKTMQLHTWVNSQPHRKLRQECLNTVANMNDYGRQSLRGSGWAASWVGHGSAYSHNMNPNEKPCFATSNEGDWWGSTVMSASSFHTGGVHSLMADGSVRFISDSINYDTWAGLGTRDGNETIGEF